MSDWNIPKEYLDQSKEIEHLQARVTELEAVLRGYVKATTGQESATVTFPMALDECAGATEMITRFHNGSWWAYSSEFDSDTGPYSTEEQAQNFIDWALANSEGENNE